MKKRFRAEEDCLQCERLSKRNNELERQIKALKKQFKKLTSRMADLEVDNVEITMELDEEFKRIEEATEVVEEEAKKVIITRPDGKVVEFKRASQQKLETLSHYKGTQNYGLLGSGS